MLSFFRQPSIQKPNGFSPSLDINTYDNLKKKRAKPSSHPLIAFINLVEFSNYSLLTATRWQPLIAIRNHSFQFATSHLATACCNQQTFVAFSKDSLLRAVANCNKRLSNETSGCLMQRVVAGNEWLRGKRKLYHSVSVYEGYLKDFLYI